ncbi:coproporphyrinogen III oxidase family protein [Geovibrio thiophilus]|uniref:Coproporphyrinogen III oxidase family protein n=1 Tax=Geovibrio thiophilus TaxID=139438 RepID=A0A3R5V093_9BACT|nr:coproporphyrinogen III oxidase family protein [Geovibrio thiophilus]QAR32512.1 coproporphyrinogen III oxidase family protein [Geovibrio thiophilus]
MAGFPRENSYLRAEDSASGDADGISWGFTAKAARLIMKSAVKYYLRFSEDSVTVLPPADKNKSYLLYLHVPFCLTLCPYCSFHRFKFNEETARRYFSLLRDEMRMTARLGYSFSSAYFGGGTTSILPDELAKTIDLARELFGITEISCESDPNHIDPESLKYTEGRIDRLSVGIQTFNDKYLENIGRKTKFGSGAEQYEKVQAILKHFPIVNVDLMYNFPGQTEEELLEDIRKVRELNPQQVTFYPLMYAPFVGRKLREKIGKSTNENEARLFALIMKNMTEPYIQRTSWAYALKKKEFIDEYVVDHSEYVGLGSGAFSFLNGTLYANSFSLKEYADRVAAGMASVVKSTAFGRHSVKQYRMMVEMFGLHAEPPYRPFFEYNALKAVGAVSRRDGKTILTPKGRFLLSVMMKGFYNGMDYIRESMRADLKAEDERICLGCREDE